MLKRSKPNTSIIFIRDVTFTPQNKKKEEKDITTYWGWDTEEIIWGWLNQIDEVI